MTKPLSNILYNCICCNAEISKLYPDLNVDDTKGMWSGGMVDRMAANYGSRFDGDVFVFCICDCCIKKKLADGIIKYWYNYMGME